MSRSEHKQVQAWRERLGLSVTELAERTGYSPKSIYWYERGETPPMRNAKSGNQHDRKHKPWVWQRFKMACAAVEAEMFGWTKGAKFAWQ